MNNSRDDEYTPTTAEVREWWANDFTDLGLTPKPAAEFDRWLSALLAAERERCAVIAESRHDLPVGADTTGRVFMQSTARFPDDGRRIAAAIRAAGNDEETL